MQELVSSCMAVYCNDQLQRVILEYVQTFFDNGGKRTSPKKNTFLPNWGKNSLVKFDSI